jgi:hypothetical protein
MLAVGDAVITTDVVVLIGEHPPEPKVVYVTVYVPAVLADASIAPEVPSIFSPKADE